MGKITTSLSQRIRLVKKFKQYTVEKRVDFMPSTLLGWMDSMGYLNTDKILADLKQEDDELKEEDVDE